MTGLNLVDRVLGVFDNKAARRFADNLAHAGLDVHRMPDSLVAIQGVNAYIVRGNYEGNTDCAVVIATDSDPTFLRVIYYDGTLNPALRDTVSATYKEQFGVAPSAFIGKDNYNSVMESGIGCNAIGQAYGAAMRNFQVEADSASRAYGAAMRNFQVETDSASQAYADALQKLNR